MITNCSSTLLDIVLTSHPERLATSGNLQVGISDHYLNFVVKKQKLPRPKATTTDFRSIKNLDQNAFRKHRRYMVSLVRPIQTSPRRTCTRETNTASQQPIAEDQPRNSKADSNTKSTLQEVSPRTNRLKLV